MSKSITEWANRPAVKRDDRDRDQGNNPDLDDYVHAFEQSQHATGSADLATFLPPTDHPLHIAVLRELVRVDLEYSWDRGSPKPLEHYQRRFPQLKADREGMREIAFEEYRLRRQAGQVPAPREYLDRFGVSIETGSRRAFSIGSSHFSASQTFDHDWPSDPGRHEISGLPEVGDQFLDFRLVGLLGKGSFGRVYLARQRGMADRPMVLKVTADRHDESQTLAQLRHDHIVPVYSSHQAGELRAVCMPYLGSVTLRDVFEDMKTQGSLPGSGRDLVSSLNKSSVRKRSDGGGSSVSSSHAMLPEPKIVPDAIETAPKPADAVETLGMLGALSYVGAVVWMGSKLAEALAHAHDRGILHRDLKPANILLTEDGKPMLLDFNLAEDLKKRREPAHATLGGTLAYMSPEHLEAFQGGKQPVDARSDIYSIGIILFEMLTGRSPFPARVGERDELVAGMIVDRLMAPPRLKPWNPAVSPAVEAIVRRCIDPDPARRYHSARQLAEDLGRHMADLPLKHAPDTSVRERFVKVWRRHPNRVITTVASVIGLVLVGVLIVQTRRTDRLQAVATAGRFTEQMNQVQYLLNFRTRNNFDLREGIAMARKSLKPIHALDSPSWWNFPPASRLSIPERDRLRDQAAELMLLLAWGEAQEGAQLEVPRDREARLRESLAISRRIETDNAPNLPWSALWRQRAKVMELLGDESGARVLKAKAEAEPLTTSIDHTLLGVELIGHSHLQALEHFKRATLLDASNFTASFGQAVCYERLGLLDRAEALYDNCLSIRRDDPTALFFRGGVNIKRGKLREAEQVFGRLRVREPANPDVVANLALIELLDGRYPEAVAGLTQAIGMGSAGTQIWMQRAEARGKQGDVEGAQRDIERALTLTPTDPANWAKRGEIRMSRKEFGAALADFDKALAVDPDLFTALSNKAYILSEKLGQTEEAIGFLTEIVERNPHFSAILADRGVLEARMGRDVSAKADGRAALQSNSHPRIDYQIACIHALTSRRSPDDLDLALRYLSTALEKGYGLDRVEHDPDLDPIRNDPQFARVVMVAKRDRVETPLTSNNDSKP